MIGHRHALDDLLQLGDLGVRERFFNRRCGRARRLADEVEFFLFRRVIDQDFKHEPVELRLGERIGPFLLDGILRRQHEERVGKRWFLPPAVTWCSCMASNRAACVLGACG